MKDQADAPPRERLVTRALRLVTASVILGLLTGALSVIAGLHSSSLGVLAAGLDVLADVTGSAILIWRFRTEQRHPGTPRAHEARAQAIVASALAVVAVILTVDSAAALAQGTHPGSSALTIASAAISFVILTPLAAAKIRTGRQIASKALQGDGALSTIGAATSLLALAALGLDHLLGWWWADRVTALAVAVFAATQAWRTRPGKAH